MKTIYIIFSLLVITYSYSQEKNEIIIKSEVNEVTVFIEGAQITRKKNVDLQPGTTSLKFVDLSPFIKGKSVQVKANGEVTVLSVNHQQNYIDQLEKPKEIKDLENVLEEIQDKIDIEKTHLSVIGEEIAFLQENKNIGGKNQSLNVTDLKSTSDFYGNKLTSLKLNEIDKRKILRDLSEKEKNILDQLKIISSKNNFANGEVVIKIQTKKQTNCSIELSYIVDNAGWFPSYDIRVKDVNEPVELIYKANVKQDTKIDWKNVKLKFSSANPNLSGSAPELKPYYLDYNTVPPRYNKSINEVSGIVFDSNNEPIPGVNVIIQGTTIGTSTNFDGFYSITVPDNSSVLEFSFIGFEPLSMPIQSSHQNVNLIESVNELDEVVVTGYGNKREKTLVDKLQGKAAGVQIRGASSIVVPLEKVENQTTVDFEIDTPFTVLSDNKSYAVDMINYNLPADYQYFSIPKIEKEAYLIARINSWEQYSLLEGEANIFFENTFVGKTILDTRFATDTLEISLGRDKNVSIQREKVTDYSSKKFVGTKKEESRVWKISAKNNKSKKINLMVLDQVPVARLDEIKVDILEVSKAKINSETGEIKWEINLEPSEKKELILNYVIKYPKNRSLVIE